MRTLKMLLIPALMLLPVACEDRAADPTKPEFTRVASDESASLATSPGRYGTLHVTKNCSIYFGNPGEFCTITSSNVKQIAVGSRIIYAAAPANGKLDSDLILDPPGPGNSVAFGHVTLDLVRQQGRVTFSGGTGKFIHFSATLDVTPLPPGPFDWQWDGAYSFRP